MKCLDEGKLRAYLDNEFPEARRNRVADHLEFCADCRERLARIEATAGRVTQWLDALEPDHLPALGEVVPRIAGGTAGSHRRWAAVALAGALAASVALFVADAPPPTRKPPAPTPPAPPAIYRAASVKHRLPVRRPKPQPVPNDFIPFDDADPMQIGMAVRVMLPISDPTLPGGAQEIAADLVIGEDGRARAIRFVK